MAEDLTQWEYKGVPSVIDISELNALGTQGWEIAESNILNGKTQSFIMKRPKRPQQGYAR